MHPHHGPKEKSKRKTKNPINGHIQQALPHPPLPLPPPHLLRRGQLAVRVHRVRPDGVRHKWQHGLRDQPHRGGRVRRDRVDPESRGVGRTDGAGARLLREGGPGHLQRARAVPDRADVLDEPDLERFRVGPSVVLQLRGGHVHGPAHGMSAEALHRRAVARGAVRDYWHNLIMRM
ncbi:hypothetical protein QJS04_geneDACA021191 [Acorus gramineus]|uniref:Uncharacterized protein n=1 Tax=Acorus gramineus TaxID=55184 RepID=A0AAV9AJI3_ACOGR|nr:hypothetical protein QJS04_geneDACA021191 [Acorus gramineus]